MTKTLELCRALRSEGFEAHVQMILRAECSLEVALSPGVGFGPGGEGFARFALIENERRIAQGIRNLKRGLTKLG